MLIITYLLIMAAGVLILIGLSHLGKTSRAHIPLTQEAQQLGSSKLRLFLDRIFPFSQSLLERLKLAGKIKNRLDAAHVKLAPAEFFNLKLLLMLFLGILVFVVEKKLEPMVLLVAGFLGYVIPEIYLNRKIAKRKRAIARIIPETVDLLGLCVEAGLDFTSAVRWITERRAFNNPMMDELTFVLEEIRWGKPRSQALKDMAKRLNIPEVSSFAQTLVQAERMGTPVSEAFNILSEDTRLQRFHRGERYAMQAPIKILIPLVFCILPVIGIIIGGPILLQFMQGKLFKGF